MVSRWVLPYHSKNATLPHVRPLLHAVCCTDVPRRHGVPVGGTAIMLALVASIGGFIFGYDTGQISDIIVLDDFRQRFARCTDRSDPATCHWPVVRSGLIVALLSVGTLIGALLGAPYVLTSLFRHCLTFIRFAERIGRRYTMIVECCVFIAGVIIQLCTFRSWPQFAAGRLVAGLGIGGLSSVVPMVSSLFLLWHY